MYKRMLLLNKKKYAAVKELTKNGKQSEVKNFPNPFKNKFPNFWF